MIYWKESGKCGKMILEGEEDMLLTNHPLSLKPYLP